MNTIKIYPEDIEDVKCDLQLNQAAIKIYFDSARYLVPLDYYNRSMTDRGFVTVRYED